MIFFIALDTAPDFVQRLQTSFELRGRFERRDDADFNESVVDDTEKFFSRGRIGINYSIGPDSSATLKYQYTNVQNMPTGGSDSQVTGQDLIEARIDHSMGGSTLTLGRQKVNKGGQRLVGALEWANSSRSWLGARLKNEEWDFFWGEMELNPKPNAQVQMAMAANKNKYGETMLIYKFDDKSANRTSVYTMDHRYTGNFGPFAVIAEGAYQWGRKGGKDHDAWAASVRGTMPVSGDVSLVLEGNVATGGGSSDTTRSFDNLFPTNHLYYGALDYQGWSNMKGLMIGLDWKVQKNFSLSANYHTFSLYDESDGWYGVGGGMNKIGGVSAIDPTGTSGDEIGTEFDLVAKFKLDNRQSLMGGIGFFQPGAFVESFVAGDTKDSFWGFFQYAAKF